MNALVPHDDYRRSTDAAGLCGEIVKQTAKPIQGRRFVSVEGWQAIAIAHGCAAGARNVERVEGGVRAIGEVRRMSDGQVISTAEGFVGEDEAVWFGGESRDKWGKVKVLPKRADYAIRAMAQTRAISRACRSAFAHVVVMIDAELSTTPAEEVPDGGFVEGQFQEAGQVSPPKPANSSSTTMPDAEWAKLIGLVEATSTDARWMCEHYKVASLRELNQADYADAIKNLNEALAKKAKDAKAKEPAKQGFGEILDDEIAY